MTLRAERVEMPIRAERVETPIRAERVGIPVRAALWAGVVLLLLGGVRLYLLHGQAILLDLRSLSGMFCF